jgi:hypothetical protein
MRTWKSASEGQRISAMIGSDHARISEWPILFSSDQWKLWGIDQASITLEHEDSAIPPLAVVREEGVTPSHWWNIVICGTGAPIIAGMLPIGVRIYEPCPRLFEPLLLLFEVSKEWNKYGNIVYPMSFKSPDALRLIADKDTLIDAVVWYDLDRRKSFRYLRKIKKRRDANRSRCPIIVLNPLPDFIAVFQEFARIQTGKAEMVEAACELYAEVHRSILSNRDSDPYGYL